MLDIPLELLLRLRSNESEQPEDMYNMGLSQSYNADIKDQKKQLETLETTDFPQATMFQHSDSLPNYLLHNPQPLFQSNRNIPVEGYIHQPEYTPATNLAVKSEDQALAPPMTIQDQPVNQMQARTKPHKHTQPQQEKKRTNFLSSAADLEYSTLSSILQENVLGFNANHSATSTEGTPNSMIMSPAISPHGYNMTKHSPSTLANNNYTAETNQHHENGRNASDAFPTDDTPSFDPKINQFQLGFTYRHPNVLFPRVVDLLLKSADMFRPSHPNLHPSFTIGVSQSDHINDRSEGLQFKEPEEIYARVTKPFLYTPGFHKLIAYLRSRFSKDKLVKMAESMAVYRPSFIACINSLRESDLIFMEQCFQRTLLTYDNFIKISGTPTIVWRRTGEIVYVGKEFTILTGWTQQQLLGPKPTFIVELLDDQSVVEYFQLFSKIAFGDFLGATMTECTLLTPNSDVKIRTGCIWTLKRDVFGIPMMIIGNFLPIV